MKRKLKKRNIQRHNIMFKLFDFYRITDFHALRRKEKRYGSHEAEFRTVAGRKFIAYRSNKDDELLYYKQWSLKL